MEVRAVMAKKGRKKFVEGGKKIYLLCAAFCLFACVFTGCGQAKNPAENQAGNQANPAGNQTGNPANPSGTGEITKTPDWMAAFQPVNGGQESPSGAGEATKAPTKAPGSVIDDHILPTMEELKALMEYPAQIPARKFTPGEGQTELVLWLPYWDQQIIDRHILAELNHILQSRGYSFYLTVRAEYPSGEKAQNYLCTWKDVLDAGETVDLLYMGDATLADRINSVRTYGEEPIVRAIRGGYLLPFSAYPETEAKKRLLEAYPESYWKVCSFQGENYGVSRGVCDNLFSTDSYLLWNLDAAAKAGLPAPEELDAMQLDELLEKAVAAGVPGAYLYDFSFATGFRKLVGALYVKIRQDGSFCLTNPYHDEEIIAIWDTLHRYKENGWLCDVYFTKGAPLIIGHRVNIRDEEYGRWLDLQENRFRYSDKNGNVKEINVKAYPCQTGVLEEGSIRNLLGITTSSKHPEEALELLSLLQSDEEIVQLLRYGLENVHYQITEDGKTEDVVTSYVHMYYDSIPPKDGIAVPITENDEPPADEEPGSCSTGNRTTTIPGKYDSLGNFLLPVELDGLFGTKDNREELARAWEGIRLLPYFGDLSEEQKEIRKRAEGILYSGSGREVFSWQPTNYKKTLEWLQDELEEIGYDRMVEEINQKQGLK